MDNQIDILGLSYATLAQLRSDVRALRKANEESKYSASQPRWPAGQPNGGQWRPQHGRQHLAAFDENRRIKCDLQRALDEELCAMQLGSWCWDSAADRWNNCMRGTYVPPLRVGRR